MQNLKFLVDANLPRRVCHWLRSYGFEALHTLDLPGGNDTDDLDLVRISREQNLVLITKDSDFETLFRTNNGPAGLLLISTGNLINRDLMALLERNRERLLQVVGLGVFAELIEDTIIVYE